MAGGSGDVQPVTPPFQHHPKLPLDALPLEVMRFLFLRRGSGGKESEEPCGVCRPTHRLEGPSSLMLCI